MNILLFGPPGAGKGTQSEMLKTQLNMKHISTGDLFRNALKNQTRLGIEAKKFIDAGQLVPDSVTIGMVEEVLREVSGKPFILDGFPRNLLQASALEEILTKNSQVLGRAIFVSVPVSVLVERLSGRRVCEKCGATYHISTLPPRVEAICDKCGGKLVQRTDDKREVIEDRIQVYEKNTRPLKDYYQEKGNLVEIDGRGDAEAVFMRIKEAMT